MRAALLAFALVSSVVSLPAATAVPWCPLVTEDASFCSEHGSDAVRHSTVQADAGPADLCIIAHTDTTEFARNGAESCGVEAATAAGDASVCFEHVQRGRWTTFDGCAAMDGAAGRAETCPLSAEPDFYLYLWLTHAGCLEHESDLTGRTRACWDRWDAIHPGVVLSDGMLCVEHEDPTTGETRVHDDALRFTNGLLNVHEGGTSVDAAGQHADASFWGYVVFGAFHDWRTSGNVTEAAGWEASAFSDPLTSQARASACVRVLAERACAP